MTGNIILMTMISKIESEQIYVSIVYNKGQSENYFKAYYHMAFNPIEYNFSYSSLLTLCCIACKIMYLFGLNFGSMITRDHKKIPHESVDDKSPS